MNSHLALVVTLALVLFVTGRAQAQAKKMEPEPASQVKKVARTSTMSSRAAPTSWQRDAAGQWHLGSANPS